jgi:hypothetical protein
LAAPLPKTAADGTSVKVPAVVVFIDATVTLLEFFHVYVTPVIVFGETSPVAENDRVGRVPFAEMELADSPAVTVTAFFCTVNDRVTLVAGTKDVSPAWSAFIVHVPAATIVTANPETVQTEVVAEESATTNPESDDGDKVIALSPKVAIEGWANVMVCVDLAAEMVTVCVASLAG